MESATATSTGGPFGRTQWSVVLGAKDGDEEVRLRSLELLLGRYRQPIVLHIQLKLRRDQNGHEMDAEEIAHDFIAHWLSRDFLRNVSPEKGSFRVFIQGCVNNFLIDYLRRRRAKKRSPNEPILSMDETDELGMHRVDPRSTALTPDQEMDVAWARQVWSNAIAELGAICASKGQGKLFSALKPTLLGDSQESNHAKIASDLGVTEVSVRVASHRMKQRLALLVQEEIRSTMGDDGDWRTELRYLVELLGKRNN